MKGQKSFDLHSTPHINLSEHIMNAWRIKSVLEPIQSVTTLEKFCVPLLAIIPGILKSS